MSLVIQTESLTKDYGAHRAITDVALEVREGEVFGYLGPNGAGKSTTIRILMDFIPRHRGQRQGIRPRLPRPQPGHPPPDGLPARRCHPLRPHDRQGPAGVLANLSGGVDQGHVERLSERLDCDLDKPIRALSRGNRQKIGLVQAFMHRSELIIMDEPSSGLDPLMQQEFYAARGGGQGRGKDRLHLVAHHARGRARVRPRRHNQRGELVTVEDVDALKERAFHQVELHFSEPVPRYLFAGLPGVQDVAVEGAVVTCTVVGKPDALIKTAARFEVVKLVSHELNLEDVFLFYYGTEARMLGNVFLKSLRDQRRSFVWWAIGLAAVTLLTVLFYPSIEGSPELNELLGDEDSIMRAFVGDLEDMTSPEGFLNSQLYFLLVPLLVIVFAVAGGSGAIAGEEEKGILDLLFSHPVRRSTVVLHKLAAMLVSVLALAAVAWIAVVVGALAVDMDIGADGSPRPP